MPANAPQDLALARAAVVKNFQVEDSVETPHGMEFLVRKVPPEEAKEAFARVASALLPSGLIPKLLSAGDHLRVVVLHGERPVSRSSKLQLLSSLVTVGTVALAGYRYSSGVRDLIGEVGQSLNVLPSTLWFVVSIFAILGMHELSHMVATRLRGGEWQPPFFIPAPPPPYALGTLGAVILSRKPLVNRDEIFDLGLSGPIVGFLVALPVSYFGVKSSFLVDQATVSAWEEAGKVTGVPSSLIYGIIQALVLRKESASGILILNTIGVAAVFGLLVTFLNLLPVSQLDGGHVFYSLFPSYRIRIIASVLSVALAFPISPLMAMLIAVFAFSVRHPPPLDEYSPLSRSRKYLGTGVYALALFLMAPLPSRLLLHLLRLLHLL